MPIRKEIAVFGMMIFDSVHGEEHFYYSAKRTQAWLHVAVVTAMIAARRFVTDCVTSAGTPILLNLCRSAIGTVASTPTLAVNMPSFLDGSMLLPRRLAMTTRSASP